VAAGTFFPIFRTFERSVTTDQSTSGVSSEALQIEKAKAGDREAFNALYRQTRENVARLVFRMGVPQSDVDDLLQEVFVQVYRSLKDFRGQAKFSTWVHRVAVNVVLMHRRAQKVRPMFTQQDELPELVEDAALPDEEADRFRRMRAFAALLERVSEKKRDVFILHELEGHGPEEIGRMVGAPVLTVRTRLFYARREIEALVKEDPLLAAFVEKTPQSGDES
jgi:RNA polymerase sigma-70 factor, ECF subfamily